MNALLPLFATAGDAANQKAANLLAAARALTPHLNRSRPLDRKLVSSVMTTTFGASDAEGAWLWRDAYDAMEAALVLQLRRLAPQISRLEDAPAEITALLANLSALGLTHTRRSEEQVALDQFSTPPELGALAVLAAQVRPGDQVLEPSAGAGLLAVLAEACGGSLTLNEVAAGRAALLEGLFPLVARSQHDAIHLANLVPTSGSFHVALVNPPFQALEAHLHAALDTLADGGRMAAIVPERLFADTEAMRSLAARGRVLLRLRFPERAYAKHGTSVETGLIVVDRGGEASPLPEVICAGTLADAARAAAGVAARPSPQPRQFRTLERAALLVPKTRALATPSGRLGFLAAAALFDLPVVRRGPRRRPLSGLPARPRPLRDQRAAPLPARGIRPYGLGRAAGADLPAGAPDRRDRRGQGLRCAAGDGDLRRRGARPAAAGLVDPWRCAAPGDPGD